MRKLRVCLLLIVVTLLEISTSLRTCTEDDYLASYTECVGGKKHLIYYKDPKSDCTGYDNKPVDVFDIPCDIHCNAGEYLPLGSKSSDDCVPCESGRYSLGGGVLINDWESETPWEEFHSLDNLKFRSYCSHRYYPDSNPPDGCTNWVMSDGDFASSGMTPDNFRSTLELTVQFVRDGSLSFLYRVNAEPNYDYFSFYIDDTVVLDRISVQPEFTEASLNVTAGVHTFKWVYTKDFLISDGEDKTYIKDLTIIGHRWTDSSCSLCPLGMFANSTGSSACSLCEPDTYADEQGLSRCESCPEHQYSFRGSSSCADRPICQESDSFMLYSECQPKGNGQSSRNKHFYWKEPHICYTSHPDSYQLPADELDIPCAPCNPGFFRDDTGICLSCPVNEYSPSNSTSCIKCDTGEVGIRKFIWNNFFELPPPSVPATMSCYGDCGSNWRLSTDGKFIDSGVGHGSYVDTYFTLPIRVVGDGQLKFTFQFDCPYGCYLTYVNEVVVDGEKRLIYNSFYSVYTYGNEIVEDTVPVKEGIHEFSWRFTKYDSSISHRDAHVKIFDIVVTNVDEGQGGASECTKCIPGTYSKGDLAFCVPCEKGRYNDENGATDCKSCEMNTFSDVIGAVTCKPCGDGTFSLEGSSECSADCIFLHNETTGYEFSNLARERMYGPFLDDQNNSHYINVCFKDAIDNPCKDENGDHYSITCVVDRNFRAQSAGRILNFYTLEDGSRGARIVYKDGSYCPTGGTRSTDIKVICDPEVGVGSPYPDEPFVTDNCTTHYVWKSLYGCPVCLPNDYSYYYTSCENGQQQKIYTWKENPRRCHGGVNLPEPEIIPCSTGDLIPCDEGEYLQDECQKCFPGTYSLGGTEVYDKWTTIPKGFKTDCQGFVCDKWKPKGHFIEGVSDSWLDLLLNFVKDGKIIFEYEGSFGPDVSFEVEIDQEVVYSTKELSLLRKKVSIDVSAGVHQIRWSMVVKDRVSPLIKDAYVRIYRISTSGTKLADNVCLKTPPGTYQPDEGKGDYLPCPENTRSDDGAAECYPCKSNEYAPVGSSKCYRKHQCTEEDYTVVYTNCLNGETLMTRTPKEPKVCEGGYQPPLIPELVPCKCPKGFYDNDGVCDTCPESYYYDEQSKECVIAPRGKAAIRTISFFEENFQQEYDVSKGCSGSCLRSWTLSDQGMDSGIQFGHANSYLEVPATIVGSEGSLFFKYSMKGPNRFEIYINGSLYDMTEFHDAQENDQRVVVPLPIGENHIVLNYVNLEDIPGQVKITEIGLTDSEFGGPVLVNCPNGYESRTEGSKTCTICPPGTYSNSLDSGGNVQCQPCLAGTYTSEYGSTKCLTCGEFGFSGNGAKTCQTSCLYNGTYPIDVNPLGESDVVVEHISGVKFEINLCSGISSSECKDSQGRPIHTHVCAIFGSTGVDYGENPEISFHDNGLIMEYTNGDVCDDYGTKRKSKIYLTCNLEMKQLGSPRYVSNSSSCEALFHWETPAACKLCTVEDYEKMYGKCSSRKREVNYLLVSEDCFESKFSKPQPYTESCSGIEFPIAGIFGIIAGIVVLIGVIVFFFFRHRKLSVEYKLLKDANVEHYEIDEENAIELEDTEHDM